MIQPHFRLNEDILNRQTSHCYSTCITLSPRETMKQTINRGTTGTRKGPSAGEIEKAKAVSTSSKQPVNDEEIRIMCVPCSLAEYMLIVIPG